MRILVTGADGFIGKNLCTRVKELDGFDIIPFTRRSSFEDILDIVDSIDAVVHLAGINRAPELSEFKSGNSDLTKQLCDVLSTSKLGIPVIFASSTQATLDNEYGISKNEAEVALISYSQMSSAKVFIFRLPNVFGKWCKPNYNSVVATFCHNIAHGKEIQVNDASSSLTLVHIDDVVEEFLSVLRNNDSVAQCDDGFCDITTKYTTTVGELSNLITSFRKSRQSLITEQVGSGLKRALYSTYVSYLPTNQFSYSLPRYRDDRGDFVEMLKTRDSGQFSFFTANKGVTRGGHYHHTKTEKFLVIEGEALFSFRHILTNEKHSIRSSGDNPQVIETVPGWSHDVTNVGSNLLVVMLWANENFNPEKPDTITSLV